ncbi:MAG: DNA recombination/repair protein RecA [Chloroflexi bacterium]|nr:DNA recombination/repair protein RecA [Chloroflexota bacterium]MBU1746301.1 DNA recombination/repair protein RecA [Chloroflexota bacterium]
MGKKRQQTRQLDAAVAQIHRRYGPHALTQGPPPTVTTLGIPTGFPQLDQALGGGLPPGQVTELLGPDTSGKTTLALKFLAQAQASGAQVGYVDQARALDPDYAHRCDLDLSRLLVGAPYDVAEALAMTAALVRSGTLAALVLDTPDFFWGDPGAAAHLTAFLARLPAPLARANTVLLVLHEAAPLPALAHHAAVRLQVVRERWLRHGHTQSTGRCACPGDASGDIRGYEARVEVLKNQHGPSGRAVTIAIEFNGTVHGNGL